jgi:hypothetical protein
MLGEREQPDDSSVRQKKIAEKMHRCGAGSAYTSFLANEKVWDRIGCFLASLLFYLFVFIALS